MIFIFYRYLRLVRRRERESDARVITAQREQYSITVHLFIGTGHSLDKITFMSLNFTANNKASCQGSSSLFSFRPVPPTTFVVVLSRSFFSHSFSARSFYSRVVSPYPTCFHPKVEASCYQSVILKNILVTFFRTFGRGSPPTVAPHSINLFLY
jgi:hypothetical protein